MKLATVITNSICEECLYKTNNYLTNPICMSCTRISILSKSNNFESKEEKEIAISIENLPSVQPIIPKNSWVLREELFDDEKEPRKAWGCKKCGFSIKSVHDKRNFCPNCGCLMGGNKE